MLAELVGGLADRPMDVGGLRIPARRGPAVVDRPAERRERDHVVASAVQGRPDQLRHAGVEDDLADCPGADVEDPRYQPPGTRDEEPSGFGRESPRPTIGWDHLEEWLHLPCESGRPRARLVVRRDGKATAHVERVEVVEAAADEGDQSECSSHAVPPRVDRAELRSDVEMDAPQPQARRRGERIGRLRQLGLGQPELARAAPDRERVVGLGRDVGVETEQDVDRLAEPARAARRASTASSSTDSTATQRSGSPIPRRANRSPQVRIGLADALERDPAVREPGRVRCRPLPARDDIRTEPASGRRADRADDGRNVVGLDAVLADPRIRECDRQLGCRRLDRGRRR